MNSPVFVVVCILRGRWRIHRHRRTSKRSSPDVTPASSHGHPNFLRDVQSSHSSFSTYASVSDDLLEAKSGNIRTKEPTSWVRSWKGKHSIPKTPPDPPGSVDATATSSRRSAQRTAIFAKISLPSTDKSRRKEKGLDKDSSCYTINKDTQQLKVHLPHCDFYSKRLGLPESVTDENVKTPLKDRGKAPLSQELLVRETEKRQGVKTCSTGNIKNNNSRSGTEALEVRSLKNKESREMKTTKTCGCPVLPSVDDLRNYAYEGEGSSPGSLSSCCSGPDPSSTRPSAFMSGFQEVAVLLNCLGNTSSDSNNEEEKPTTAQRHDFSDAVARKTSVLGTSIGSILEAESRLMEKVQSCPTKEEDFLETSSKNCSRPGTSEVKKSLTESVILSPFRVSTNCKRNSSSLDFDKEVFHEQEIDLAQLTLPEILSKCPISVANSSYFTLPRQKTSTASTAEYEMSRRQDDSKTSHHLSLRRCQGSKPGATEGKGSHIGRSAEQSLNISSAKNLKFSEVQDRQFQEKTPSNPSAAPLPPLPYRDPFVPQGSQ